MRLAPLLTRHADTGAVRPVTPALLAEVFLAPREAWEPEPAILALEDAPWAASAEADPDGTARAVTVGLVRAMNATRRLDPAELDPRALPEGRARTHLAALHRLWLALDGAVPDELRGARAVLSRAAGDALEPLPILDPTPCTFATPLETEVADRLVALFGSAPEAARRAWATGRPGHVPIAGGALRHLQGALGQEAHPAGLDATVAVHGLRGPIDEAEFVAACVARLLDQGRVDRPAEIGLLAPADWAGVQRLAEVLDAAGLPLSGGPAAPGTRDVVGETLVALLHVLAAPGARVALAGLLRSPLMPWDGPTGARMARQVIEYGRLRDDLRALAGPLVDEFRPGFASISQLFARLASVRDALPDGPHRAAFGERIAGLRSVAGDALDWPALLERAEPRPTSGEDPARTVEGITLFSERALPWRRVRHLIAVGLAGRVWPRPAPADPLFTESEIVTIARTTGLCLPGRGAALARQTEIFRRHLCAATDGVTLTAPARDVLGARLDPAPVLSLVAHALGADSAEALVRDLDHDPARWPCAHRRVPLLPDGGAPQAAGDRIELAADLLRLRLKADGQPEPQSPSRLETMLVSPFAWLLNEIGARDRTWVPPSLGPLELGALLHGAFEGIFATGEPVPDETEIARRLPAAFEAALAAEVPWLAGELWATERASARAEAGRAAQRWGRFLREAGAEILAAETPLAGEGPLGLSIGGRADCALRIPAGPLVVVDHKRSSSGGRRTRMEAGWDLQVALYRAMLQRPQEATSVTRLVAEGTPVATAYHLTRDGTILTDAAGAGLPGAEPITVDTSEAALHRLHETLRLLSQGILDLGRSDDADTFGAVGLRAYALEDAPLVSAFLAPAPETDSEPEKAV